MSDVEVKEKPMTYEFTHQGTGSSEDITGHAVYWYPQDEETMAEHACKDCGTQMLPFVSTYWKGDVDGIWFVAALCDCRCNYE